MVDDPKALTQRVQELLSHPDSAHRTALNGLVFDALLAAPTSTVLGDPELADLIVSGLTEDNARAVVVDAIRPGFDRVQAQVAAREDTLRDLLPDSAVHTIAELIARGKGPRFGWLHGAVDAGLIRQLFAPVVQETLLSFAQNMPLTGAGAADGGAEAGKGGRRGGGLMGGFAKQVSRSAGQLADFGKGMMGGLGAELERRVAQLARDFSHTAMTQARDKTRARLRSEEGKQLLTQMREQSLERVLATPAQQVVDDFMELPGDDIAALIPSIVDHNRRHALVPAIIAGEVRALLDLVGELSLGELLKQGGLYDETRALALRAVDGSTADLMASDAFGDWLKALLDEV